ncbi:MAG TPA: hypothetical protein HPP83_08600 [Candidatus Hydrogenedentes bacterium]|nr:hypothetical protein [Candidatus Hydrogenedentota bacterium]
MKGVGFGVGCVVVGVILLLAASCAQPSRGARSLTPEEARTLAPEEAKAELRKREIFFSRKSFLQSAAKRDLVAVNLFLAGGIDINARDESGASVLSQVVSPAHKEVAKLLIDNGADVNIHSDTAHSALWNAAQFGDVELVRILLAKGADPNYASPLKQTLGKTPLMIASDHGKTEMVEALLAHGADPDLRDSRGNTAWSLARNKGHN